MASSARYELSETKIAGIDMHGFALFDLQYLEWAWRGNHLIKMLQSEVPDCVNQAIIHMYVPVTQLRVNEPSSPFLSRNLPH
jgi:hypothetical protein